MSTKKNNGDSVLLASAALLGGAVLLSASGAFDRTARAEMSSAAGGYTAMTTDGGTDEVLVVTDDRTESLMVFQVVSGKRLELVAKHGGEVRFIHAHRQSAAKPSDPGSRIWKAVGRWGEEELGLSSGPPGYHIGNGLPLPTAWDPRIADTPYSWRVRGY